MGRKKHVPCRRRPAMVGEAELAKSHFTATQIRSTGLAWGVTAPTVAGMDAEVLGGPGPQGVAGVDDHVVEYDGMTGAVG